MNIWNSSYPQYKEFHITQVTETDLIDLHDFIKQTTQVGIKFVEIGTYKQDIFPENQIDKGSEIYKLYIEDPDSSFMFKMRYGAIIEYHDPDDCDCDGGLDERDINFLDGAGI